MKFSDDVGDPILSKALSIVYIIFPSEDIRHIVEKPNKRIKFCWPQFFGRGNSNFSAADCLLSTVWQSLAEFCLLPATYAESTCSA